MDINPRILEWFEKRGIPKIIVEGMGIYSGQHRQAGDGSFEVVPHPNGNVIVFPYLREGVAVNEKFRGSEKKFYQRPGGQKVFYNRDVFNDPQLVEGRTPLIIVEGEMDCLSVMAAGNPFVVSVPDGAPPPSDSIASTDDIDPDHDDKYGYIIQDWEALKRVKRIVIATDSDAPGMRLAEELVRRLGRVRCSFVRMPDGSKDMNEVLLNHGPAMVAEIINRAEPYPVSGIYTYNQLPNEPDLSPVSTGFYRLDPYLKLFYPALMVVTGMAGSGKSTLVNQMVAQLCLLHKWKVGIASFEMRIKPFVTNALLQVYFDSVGSKEEWGQEWLDRNFIFIAPEPTEEDAAFDIDWLIEKAIAAVIRHGIRVLVIDPWNEIEHAVGRRESLTDYTGRAIRALKRFGREFECLVIVVAHPTKSGADKKPPDISLYDVSDSAHFANKADFGVVVARCGGEHDLISEVFVKKVRYQPISGRPGSITLAYDPKLGKFSQ